jgi:hypothetical protein
MIFWNGLSQRSPRFRAAAQEWIRSKERGLSQRDDRSVDGKTEGKTEGFMKEIKRLKALTILKDGKIAFSLDLDQLGVA